MRPLNIAVAGSITAARQRVASDTFAAGQAVAVRSRRSAP